MLYLLLQARIRLQEINVSYCYFRIDSPENEDKIRLYTTLPLPLPLQRQFHGLHPDSF